MYVINGSAFSSLSDHVSDWIDTVIAHLRHHVGSKQLALLYQGSSIMNNRNVVPITGIPGNVVVNPAYLWAAGVHPSWLEHYLPTCCSMGYHRSRSESSVSTVSRNRLSSNRSSSSNDVSGQGSSSDRTANRFSSNERGSNRENGKKVRIFGGMWMRSRKY